MKKFLLVLFPWFRREPRPDHEPALGRWRDPAIFTFSSHVADPVCNPDTNPSACAGFASFMAG
jgi:hypothetical protein